MPNPFGADIVSPIPRPRRSGAGEIVPRPGLPPGGIPFYLRPIPVNTRDPREVLAQYVDRNKPRVARFLYSTWNNERRQLTFQEIRNAIRDRQVPADWIERWRQDYSTFVTETLDPEWRKAMAGGASNVEPGIASIAGRAWEFTPVTNAIEEWLTTRGGELAVALTDQQHAAMRSLIRHFTLEEPVTAEQLGRILRPVIGLTPKQATAVQAFRRQLIKNGLTAREVEHQVGNYGGRLWRMRGLRIARTELAFAHNFGQMEAIRQGQADGTIRNQVIKRWRTRSGSTDPFCISLNNQRIDISETFPGATEKLPNTFAPPAHPNCQCGVTYEVLAPQAGMG